MHYRKICQSFHMFSQKGEHIIMASTSQDGSVWLSRNLVGWGGGGVISFDLCEYPWCVQKWRAHWNMPKYNEDWRTIQKALKSIHNSKNGVTFTNLCTACSGTHSLIPHTYTATYVHLHNCTHTVPAQVYWIHRSTTVVHEHMYTWKWTYVYVNVHWSMEHLLVARDVTLGHVVGLVCESFAYTCTICTFQRPYSPHVGLRVARVGVTAVMCIRIWYIWPG